MTDRRLNLQAYRRVRQYVLDRDLHRCQIHGPRCTTWATECDHIISRADGGNVFDPANCRAACRRCNGWRAAAHTNTMRYRTTLAHTHTRM